MNKQSKKIREWKTNNVFQIGDTVRIIDGSALSCDSYSSNDYGPVIVSAYPNITGSNSNLKDLEFTVKEVNVKDRIVSAALENTYYLQDITIEYNNAIFRTTSASLLLIKSTSNKMNTEKITQELDAMSERINAIKAEINKPDKVEPKEGEWWYGMNDCGIDWVSKLKRLDGKYFYYSESYTQDKLFLNGTHSTDHPTFRLATTDEITHFMGLHAERLGMKEGVKIDRSKLDQAGIVFSFNILGNCGKPFFDRYGRFIVYGLVVRDSQGNWAEVVKDEKVVVNGYEVTYNGNFCQVNSLNLSGYSIEKLFNLTKSPELKKILDGFKKQK
jgi:hypothetical protein